MAARILRIEHEGTSRYALERNGGTRLIDGDVFEQWGTGRDFRLGSDVKPTKILAPVRPSKIVALGLNYRDHAATRGPKVLTRSPRWVRAFSPVNAGRSRSKPG